VSGHDAASRDQATFYSVYRGRQSRLHHLAYMRTGKVKAAELLFARNGIRLSGISVFDFGFGPGTLFRRCDVSCKLAGIELDPENVAAVRRMLECVGHEVSRLEASEIGAWRSHPLLAPGIRYDLVVLSHVLEHMDDPAEVLRRLRGNLTGQTGRLLVLVPINERRVDPNHKWACDRALVGQWVDAAGLRVVDSVELDHWMYWALPFALADASAARTLWSAISVVLGLFQAAFSPAGWFGLGRAFGWLTRAKPAQAAFLLAAKDSTT
jgi:SAM-dependent methyltransferase